MRYKIFGHAPGCAYLNWLWVRATLAHAGGHGAERAEAKEVFDLYVEAGGNFIETADSYQFGEAEELVGEFIAGGKPELLELLKVPII
jgi:aryl-alcohol dehydrogenase-like predicted oxidoreductase